MVEPQSNWTDISTLGGSVKFGFGRFRPLKKRGTETSPLEIQKAGFELKQETAVTVDVTRPFLPLLANFVPVLEECLTGAGSG